MATELRVKAVFFDLDDTLCAYWEASKRALRKTFSKWGPEGHEAEEMAGHWAAAFRDFSPHLRKLGWYESYLRKGESTRIEQMRLTLARVGISDETLAKKLSDAYAHERNAGLRLFEEAWEVLETLAARFPLGIITNGPADVQREEIETLGIGHFFKWVYIEGEMGKGKPLPEVFEMIRRDVGVAPGEILFVGNSYAHDIRPALEAGWHAIWVRRDTDLPPSYAGYKATLEQKPEGAPTPDATISDLRDVLSLLHVPVG